MEADFHDKKGRTEGDGYLVVVYYIHAFDMITLFVFNLVLRIAINILKYNIYQCIKGSNVYGSDLIDTNL